MCFGTLPALLWQHVANTKKLQLWYLLPPHLILNYYHILGHFFFMIFFVWCQEATKAKLFYFYYGDLMIDCNYL